MNRHRTKCIFRFAGKISVKSEEKENNSNSELCQKVVKTQNSNSDYFPPQWNKGHGVGSLVTIVRHFIVGELCQSLRPCSSDSSRFLCALLQIAGCQVLFS